MSESTRPRQGKEPAQPRGGRKKETAMPQVSQDLSTQTPTTTEQVPPVIESPPPAVPEVQSAPAQPPTSKGQPLLNTPPIIPAKPPGMQRVVTRVPISSGLLSQQAPNAEKISTNKTTAFHAAQGFPIQGHNAVNPTLFPPQPFYSCNPLVPSKNFIPYSPPIEPPEESLDCVDEHLNAPNSIEQASEEVPALLADIPGPQEVIAVTKTEEAPIQATNSGEPIKESIITAPAIPASPRPMQWNFPPSPTVKSSDVSPLYVPSLSSRSNPLRKAEFPPEPALHTSHPLENALLGEKQTLEKPIAKVEKAIPVIAETGPTLEESIPTVEEPIVIAQTAVPIAEEAIPTMEEVVSIVAEAPPLTFEETPQETITPQRKDAALKDKVSTLGEAILTGARPINRPDEPDAAIVLLQALLPLVGYATAQRIQKAIELLQLTATLEGDDTTHGST